MNDPHVACLRYRLVPGPRASYRAPPPVPIDSEQFEGVLEDGLLTLVPKDHYPSIAAARDTADRFVRAWEVHTTLNGMPGAVAFDYESGEVEDRDPPPAGDSQVLQVHGAIHGHSAAHVTLSVVYRQYPAPPEYFRFTSDVEVLWNRMEGHREGREPLLSMGYFCLTWIEKHMAGGRSDAGKRLNADQAVLKKLSELTSTRGDPGIARKIERRGALKPLSESEARWIVAALESLLRNAGEYSNNVPDRITLNNLPAL